MDQLVVVLNLSPDLLEMSKGGPVDKIGALLAQQLRNQESLLASLARIEKLLAAQAQPALKPSSKPSLHVRGVTMTGDLIFGVVLPTTDNRTTGRHVVVSILNGAVLAQGDVTGAGQTEFTDPALMAPAGSQIHVDITSTAPGLASAQVAFDLPLTDTRPLAASGSPTLEVKGVAA